MALLGSNRSSGKAYIHIMSNLKINGPKIPSLNEIECGDYLKQVKTPPPSVIAGGYLARIGCMRALMEARQDLFFLDLEQF